MAPKRKPAGQQSNGETKLSRKERQAMKADAEGMMDAYMRAIGCPDPSKYTDEDGFRHIMLGSATGRMGILEIDDALFLHVLVRVMPLPADRDLIVPLMRELLALNLKLAGSFRLGLGGDTVFAGVTRALSELNPDSLVLQIHDVAEFADAIDDDLKKKYEGTSLARQAPPS